MCIDECVCVCVCRSTDEQGMWYDMKTEVITSSNRKPNYQEDVFGNKNLKELCLADKSGIYITATELSTDNVSQNLIYKHRGTLKVNKCG